MTRVADEILAYCGSCKMDLRAVVVAMRGDQVLRVQCKTCRSDRNFKPPKGLAEPTAPTRKKIAGPSNPRAASGTKSVEDEWRAQMATVSQQSPLLYAPTQLFRAKDRIKHPQFGEGVVQKSIPPNKIEVLFAMDLKVLMCKGERPR